MERTNSPWWPGPSALWWPWRRTCSLWPLCPPPPWQPPGTGAFCGWHRGWPWGRSSSCGSAPAGRPGLAPGACKSCPPRTAGATDTGQGGREGMGKVKHKRNFIFNSNSKNSNKSNPDFSISLGAVTLLKQTQLQDSKFSSSPPFQKTLFSTETRRFCPDYELWITAWKKDQANTWRKVLKISNSPYPGHGTWRTWGIPSVWK